MLFDVRRYQLKVGAVNRYNELYRKLGYGVQVKHLGRPIVYLSTETGELNQVLHIWQYNNAGEREQLRKALWADADWLSYVKQLGDSDLILSQSNELMTQLELP